MSIDYTISQAYTETAGRRPSADQLDTGQLWINIADKVIGTKNSDGELVELASSGIAGSNIYAVCSTDAGVAEKTVTVDASFNLQIGTTIIVKFTQGNTATSPTLNINDTGAKPLYYCDASIPTTMTPSACTIMFVYSGTSYDVLGGGVSVDTTQYYTKEEADTHFVASTNGIVSGSLTIE